MSTEHGTEEQIQSYALLPEGATFGDVNDRIFTVYVQWFGQRDEKGYGGYGVTVGEGSYGLNLSRAGNWGHPERFQRRQYRWETFEEALDMARKYVNTVKVGGRTWAEFKEYWELKQREQV